MDRKERHAALPALHAPVARVDGGKFVSPLERGDDGVAGCCNVNTWPVLATPEDDAVLGPTIMLPDHPQIAPESVNDFFDGTEIEEALVLHIQALATPSARRSPQRDPKVREMLARADATTPEQLMDLHGRVRMQDPAGRAQAAIGGAGVKRGDKVVLRPGAIATSTTRWSTASCATCTASSSTTTNRTHIGVTVDDDPMRRSSARAAASSSSSPTRWRWRHGEEGPSKRILVAGVGNIWLCDDGFGCEVIKRLNEREGELPAEVAGRRLRHRRPGARLRGHARLRRAGARRRQPAGRRARNAVRHGDRRGLGIRRRSRTATRSTRTPWTPRAC